MMVFCDSALLSQLTTFELHGGEPGHALHKRPYANISKGEDAPTIMPALEAMACFVVLPCWLLVVSGLATESASAAAVYL
jgi:hypothetical protein